MDTNTPPTGGGRFADDPSQRPDLYDARDPGIGKAEGPGHALAEGISSTQLQLATPVEI